MSEIPLKWLKRARPTDWIIMVATVVIAGVGIFQLCTMSGQLAEMKKASDIGENTIKLAEGNLKLTEGNIKATQEQFTINQRAVVSVKKVVINGADGITLGTLPLGNPNIGIIYENSGQTIARKVFSNHYIGYSPPPPNFNVRFPDNRKSNSWLISPKDSDTIDNFTITPSDIITIQNSLVHCSPCGQILYVYGYVYYSDVFNIRHKTQFCFKNIAVAADNNIVKEYIFHKCGQHDCNDKDCDNN